MATPQEGLAALRAAADSGALAELCARHGIRILTVFGSVARAGQSPRDLDIGIMFEPGVAPDHLAAIGDLVDLTGVENVDVAHLNRGGPVIRERALVGSVALYESEPGALAGAQISAIGERIDTDRMRQLDLELLAG